MSGVHSTGGKWFQRLAPRPSPALRLFCFPYAGTGASVYRLWPAELPVEVEVCAVQLPGRGNRLREPPLASVPVLVEALLEAMTPDLDVPFAFFGHSMGAILAYEVAYGLTADGHPVPRQLFLSGRRPPDVPDPSGPLHGLDDEAFVAEINRRYGGIPKEVLEEPDVLALLLPCLRADIAALETHCPVARAPLDIPISVYGGTEDKLTPLDHLEAWRRQTTASFRMRTYPGGHFYLDGHRRSLIADVEASLAPFLAHGSEMRRRA